MGRTKYLLLCFLILFLSITLTRNQGIYYLVSDLEPLLQTQRRVIADLRTVIRNKKKIYYFIRRETIRFKTEHKKAKADLRRYLKNQVNAFTLIKRMSTDLEYIKNITEQSFSLMRSRTLKYPTYEDLDQAVRMIVRLQRVFLLNITQLADGLLENTFSEDGRTFKEQFLPMSASDCYEISKVLYKNKDYNIGLSWLHEALRVYDKEKPRLSLGVTKVDILHSMSKGYETLKNYAQYIVWTKKLLDLNPPFDQDTIADLGVMVDIYQMRINEQTIREEENQRKNKKKKEKNQEKEQTKQKKKKLSKEQATRKFFRMLCRGHMLIEHDVSKRLHCWYFLGHHPFSKLAPFKAEQLFIRPDILLIHNAISDAEIQTVKNIALPELRIFPARNQSNSGTMHIRLAKSMEFTSRQSEFVGPLNQRISDMTGLLATLHPLSVSNYGVGGHNVIHEDSSEWLDRETMIKKAEGKYGKWNKRKINAYIDNMSKFFRMSTVLFYLSEVEQGGDTVFPWIGLRVTPTKGAALVWRNLLPTGELDRLTGHGACPVLRGSKWVANKWIIPTNQELQKPCAKDYTPR